MTTPSLLFHVLRQKRSQSAPTLGNLVNKSGSLLKIPEKPPLCCLRLTVAYKMDATGSYVTYLSYFRSFFFLILLSNPIFLPPCSSSVRNGMFLAFLMDRTPNDRNTWQLRHFSIFLMHCIISGLERRIMGFLTYSIRCKCGSSSIRPIRSSGHVNAMRTLLIVSV